MSEKKSKDEKDKIKAKAQKYAYSFGKEKHDPYLRMAQEMEEKKYEPKKKPKKERMFTVKSWKQSRVELHRLVTRTKLQIIPFLRTLDASFFVRLAFFCTLVYYSNKFA